MSIYDKLRKYGKGTIIYDFVRIPKPELVEIGDYSKIDDFAFLYAGNGIKIGKHVHIATGVKIIGAGYLELGDHVALAQNVVILTSTNDYRGGYHMSAASPREQQNIRDGVVIIEKDGFVGAGSVVHPNIKIGEGAIVGSNSLVLKDVKPWTINIGSPCKVIGIREKIKKEFLL